MNNLQNYVPSDQQHYAQHHTHSTHQANTRCHEQSHEPTSYSCILKVIGKHGLVFKARHSDRDYLQTMADEIMASETSEFTDYEIHLSDHANEEMTEPEHLLHIDCSELHYQYAL